MVDGWDHPLVSEWYLPDGGREGGGAIAGGFLMRVDRTISVPGKYGANWNLSDFNL